MEVGDRIDEWVNQYVRGVLSEKDRIELLRWLGGAPEHEKQFREMLRIAIRVSAVGQWSENVEGKSCICGGLGLLR